jgi:oxygen-independent coproporphyrinogen-3 oxidase
MNQPVSLYIHIPFCGVKCTYCAFNTYINLDHLIAPFVQALIREIAILGTYRQPLLIHTVYLGGGTPSLLMPQQIGRILATIHEHFDLLPDAEISMEANPDDLDESYMAAVRESGINRISIGMQSANSNELALFARRHDFTTVTRAVAAARTGGIDNLNLDLIYGVPRQTVIDWENSLQEMFRLTPDHVSLYALGIEDGTAMQSWVENGRLPQPDDDLVAEMYDLATDLLEGAGYEQYEISNWAKPGFACRHNLQYWRNLPYFGLGPGAHGYASGVRYVTVLSPHYYIKAITEASSQFAFPLTPATDTVTAIDRDADISETIIMGLRLTNEGINRATFSDRFGVDLVDKFSSIVERFVEHGLLYVDQETVRLTKRGRFLSNVVFREFV